MGEYVQLLLFLVAIVGLYLISRRTIHDLFYFLSHVIPSKKAVFSVISALFFPGTVIHEMAHYLMATVLFLKVREVRIFPKFEEGHITLGTVTYERKDSLRGILVGIAPILVGLLLFYLMASLSLLRFEVSLMQAGMIYLVFTISTTMFSSKQDLVDLVFLIPFIIVLLLVLYFLQIPAWTLFLEFVVKANGFFSVLNHYLVICLIIHIALIASIKLLRQLFSK